MKIYRPSKQATATIVFKWDTQWYGTETQSVYWQKQAGTIADSMKARFVVGGKTFDATSDLSQDRVLLLSPTGLKIQPGHAGQAQLPLFGGST